MGLNAIQGVLALSNEMDALMSAMNKNSIQLSVNFTIDFIPISGRISMRNRSITEVVLDDDQIVGFDDETFTDSAMSYYSYTSDIKISDKTEYSCEDVFELKKNISLNGRIDIYPSNKYYIMKKIVMLHYMRCQIPAIGLYDGSMMHQEIIL